MSKNLRILNITVLTLVSESAFLLYKLFKHSAILLGKFTTWLDVIIVENLKMAETAE